jgi:hypothetical protein
MTLTQDTAVDSLMHADRKSLAEMCYYMHKDQYGIKDHHLMNKPVPELVSWIITHYTFNEQNQAWETIIPFEE